MYLAYAVNVSVRDAEGNPLNALVHASVGGGEPVTCFGSGEPGQFACTEQGGSTYTVSVEARGPVQTKSVEVASAGCHVTSPAELGFVFESTPCSGDEDCALAPADCSGSCAPTSIDEAIAYHLDDPDPCTLIFGTCTPDTTVAANVVAACIDGICAVQALN